MRRRKTPYQRIMAAAYAGRGLRLSYDEVYDLSRDEMIISVALQDDEADIERTNPTTDEPTIATEKGTRQ